MRAGDFHVAFLRSEHIHIELAGEVVTIILYINLPELTVGLLDSFIHLELLYNKLSIYSFSYELCHFDSLKLITVF